MILPSDNRNNPALLIIECGLALITAALAFGWPSIGRAFFARTERAFSRLARCRFLSIFTVGLSVVVLRLAILPVYGIPLPFVPDDFSFLLASDTFAHGHLTNPTPPLWTHFETIHETMVPTYQSMYFPGQGLLLAAGTVVFGRPWFALLVMDFFMCAGLTWMLQAWLPPPWALLGGFIAVIRLGVFSYWINTYHTGALVSAFGGMLVLGGLPRLMRAMRFRYAMAIGAGVAILSLTRPYEGVLLCVPVGAMLGWWMVKGKNRPPAATCIRYAAVPLLLIAGVLAWLGYYDLKAFGKATTLPYVVDRQQYAMAPYYVWQHARPELQYRHVAMRDFYLHNEFDNFKQIHTWKGFVPQTLVKTGFTILFYAGFTLLLPLIMIRRVFLDKRIRFLVLCVLVLATGSIIEIYLLPYYVAPFVGAFYAIGLQAMRHLRVWMPEGKPVGLAMVRLTVISCLGMGGLRFFARPLHLAPSEWGAGNWTITWFGPEHYGTERAGIERKLEQLPGGQLVLVRYSSKHNPLDQWIYNSADIEHAKVIWAWDMGPEENRKLIAYFRDRKVWLVEPDTVPARLIPYCDADGKGNELASQSAPAAGVPQELNP